MGLKVVENQLMRLENDKGHLEMDTFQVAVLGEFARKDARIETLRRIFNSLDADHSGELNFSEFEVGWELLGLPGDKMLIVEAFDLMDEDKSGRIDWEEFRDRMLSHYHEVASNKLE